MPIRTTRLTDEVFEANLLRLLRSIEDWGKAAKGEGKMTAVP